MSPALTAYLAASRLGDTVAPGVLRRRLARGKEDPARLGERLGRAGLPRPGGRLVWIHAASVGEAVSALPLIGGLSDRGLRVLLTSGTVSSAGHLAGKLPERAVHQFAPVDTARAVRGFLDHWRPDLAVWVESELWPRLVVETARRGVPMALVNARLSAASARRWGRLRGMARHLLCSFGTILAQDEETVARLRGLGVGARFAGNLKALVPAPACDPAELAALGAAISGRPTWLAASTHPGEESAALAAHRQLRGAVGRPLLIVAPRHPERGGEVARMAAEGGLCVARRTAGEVPDATTDVMLADTLGEMGLWYRLAPVAFVGGSLVPVGGHTPFEPAQLGCAVLHGPHVANFAPAYAALDGAGAALLVGGADELARAVAALLDDVGRAERMRSCARQVHSRLKPDLDAIADHLVGLMRVRS